MIRHLAIASALTLVAIPAIAQDARLVEVEYDEARVFRIEGKPKVQATIRFAEDESIENVAIGDSAAWQVTPNKRANLLFVKPLEPRAATNMTVVTNKRTYLFDLVATPTGRPLYVMSFTYPGEPQPAPEAQQLAADERSAVERAATEDGLAVIDPSDLNFAWSGSGDQTLLPTRVFDDGTATFMTWPSGRPVPAILTTNPEGTEGPVNFTVRGDTIVIDGVPREIVLRSGEDRATMVNGGPQRPASSAARDASFALSAEKK
ncbi:TrbG/VirB9 family P-type conjugative transfer protein [Qipengyuania spongiae]|uniref:TrbG/VirB9 family P-type conjugative transfer protein n=1 Tax=Qipengyuania spongiae TaxID=2909673 RepID=A0ABY5SYD6_9SPHN|nr:TrbG/VirB9 family P-type conjugative transfer protein [Qipengyuania spongiae]UVI39254.1 TrbG/VirB9 family P-type conjugative transfer protein [Qipengyuania spongiae]